MSEFTESGTFQILEEYFLNILYSLECMATDMTHYLKGLICIINTFYISFLRLESQ